jgi:hypothetical protein
MSAQCRVGAASAATGLTFTNQPDVGRPPNSQAMNLPSSGIPSPDCVTSLGLSGCPLLIRRLGEFRQLVSHLSHRLTMRLPTWRRRRDRYPKPQMCIGGPNPRACPSLRRSRTGSTESVGIEVGVIAQSPCRRSCSAPPPMTAHWFGRRVPRSRIASRGVARVSSTGNRRTARPAARIPASNW